MKKISSKKWKWIIGSTISAFSIIPLVAVSAVACSQPTLNQQVSNQEIANALQNYFAKKPNLLNGSAVSNEQNNIFLSSMYYLNWSSILSYLRKELSLKPKLNIGNNNYNLNAIGVQTLNSSNYNYVNGSITFTLTYIGVTAKNSLTITNLQNIKPIQNPSIKINVQPQNVQAGNGLPAQISVSAIGQYNPAASLSYQWYFKQDGYAEFVALKNNGAYSGVNTATLNIASTNANTIGAYYVLISFPFANSIMSTNAILGLITNHGIQVNNVFNTTKSGNKQEISPTLSSNVANAVNGVNGSNQYIGPDGKINNQGIDQIKKAIQKTLASNPDTAGYQNLPIKITTSNVNDKNEININYQIGDIKGQIDNVNVGLNQNQTSQKLTEWLNTGNNLVDSFQNYLSKSPNDILKFTLGRHVIDGYQWQNNQLPNVEIVPNSWKLLNNQSVIYNSQKEFVPLNADIIKSMQNYVISQKDYNGFAAWYNDTKILKVTLKTTSEAHLIRTNSKSTSSNPPNQPIINIPSGSKITTVLPYTGDIKLFFITKDGVINKYDLATIIPSFVNNNGIKSVNLTWNADFYKTTTDTPYSFSYNSSINKNKPFVLNGITYYIFSIGYKYNQFNIKAPTGKAFIINQNGATGSNQANFSEPFNDYQSHYKWLSSLTTPMPISGLPYYLTNNNK